MAPFAFINGEKPHKLMSRGACPTLLVILVSPGLMSQEERASAVKVRESNFMVVESAAGNEKAPVVKGNMHKLQGHEHTLILPRSLTDSHTHTHS